MKIGKRGILNRSCKVWYLDQHTSIKKIMTFHDFSPKLLKFMTFHDNSGFRLRFKTFQVYS